MTKSYLSVSKSFLKPLSVINSVSNERRLISAFGCKILAILAVVSLISKAEIVVFIPKWLVTCRKLPVPTLGSKIFIEDLPLKLSLIRFWTAFTNFSSV